MPSVTLIPVPYKSLIKAGNMIITESFFRLRNVSLSQAERIFPISSSVKICAVNPATFVLGSLGMKHGFPTSDI